MEDSWNPRLGFPGRGGSFFIFPSLLIGAPPRPPVAEKGSNTLVVGSVPLEVMGGWGTLGDLGKEAHMIQAGQSAVKGNRATGGDSRGEPENFWKYVEETELRHPSVVLTWGAVTRTLPVPCSLRVFVLNDNPETPDAIVSISNLVADLGSLGDRGD